MAKVDTGRNKPFIMIKSGGGEQMVTPTSPHRPQTLHLTEV